jgi:hypothetical protein
MVLEAPDAPVSGEESSAPIDAGDGATSSSVEREAIFAAVRLGWHFAELHGRLDPLVPEDDGDGVQYGEHALRLSGEFAPKDRIAEALAVVSACQKALDLEEPRREGLVALRRTVPKSRDQKAWPAFAAMAARWDEHFQFALAARSTKLVAGYELGRSVAEVRWALDPEAPSTSSSSWEHLLGDGRRAAIWRFIKLLSPYYEKLAASALLTSLAVWGQIAENPDWRRGSVPCLSEQLRTWHDIISGDRSGQSYLEGDPLVAVWSPSRLVPILSKFPIELSLLALSFGGIVVAALFLAPLISNSGVKSSVTAATQGTGGAISIGSVVSAVSLLTALAAGLLARARLSFHDLGARIGDESASQLILEAVLVLPPPAWYPPPKDNYLWTLARFKRRFAAWAADTVLVTLGTVASSLLAVVAPLYFVRTVPVHSILILAGLTTVTAYYVLFMALLGRTPGMVPWHLFLVRQKDGRCVSLPRTLAHAVGWIVPFFAVVVIIGHAPHVGWVDVALAVAAAVCIAGALGAAVGVQPRSLFDWMTDTILIETRSPLYDCHCAPDRFTPALGEGLEVLERRMTSW